MGGVYRALDRLTGQEVALKQVGSAVRDRSSRAAVPGIRAMTPTPSSARRTFQLALAHEFRTLTTLRHPNIVSVLDYGFDAEREPFFTMQLLEAPRDLLTASHGASVPQKLSILAQLLRALVYLHRHNIVHRDLKPSNVLVVKGPEGPLLKLLDFGIAAHRDSDVELSGTLTYMAPEVLAGHAATPASDLYAVGVLLYQMLFGRPPYLRIGRDDSHKAVAQLADDELTSTPDDTDEETHISSDFTLDSQAFTASSHDQLTSERLVRDETLDLHPLTGRLADLLRALLAIDPTARPTQAEQALRQLSEVMQELDGTALPEDTAETRESILQAAVLVGREPELTALEAALAEAAAGRGGLLLIGGESGVGKSRLMEELRTIALVRGIRTLRGQAISNGGTAYQIFHEPLRQLALSTAWSDEEAAVLKEIVPELPALLERMIPDAPQLVAKDSRERTRRVLLSSLLRAPEPQLLLLEDLHWASAESRELLQALAESARAAPLLIVVSFRNDESRELPAQFPKVRCLSLPRLDERAIERLSQSMLGEAGARPELLHFLHRETEGNALFIIEVLRALAEDAGGLDAVGTRDLPQHVSSGGVQAVVQRRLGRAPAWTRRLLKLAAVAGRRIDRRVLGACEAQLDDWLHACTDAAILEVCESEWRFAHDKLREGLLANLPHTEELALHRELGETIERVYAENERPLAALAHHFERAGDAAKASTYASLAGSNALRNGMLHEALAHLQRAVLLQEQARTEPLERAATLRRLSRTLLGLGHTPESAERVRQALGLLGQAVPRKGLARWLALFREGGVELRHRFVGAQVENNPRKQAELRELLALIRGTNETLFVSKGHQDEALLIMLRTLHAAERVEDRKQQVNTLSWLAYASYLAPLHKLGHFYLQRAMQLRQGPTLSRDETGLYAMQAYFYSAEGNWEPALAGFDSWVETSERHGVSDQAALAHSSRAATRFMVGMLAGTLEDAEACMRLGQRMQNPIYTGSAIGWHALVDLRRGDFEQAFVNAHEAQRHVSEIRDTAIKMNSNSLLGCAAALTGRLDIAAEQLDAALSRLQRMWPAAPSFLPIYAYMLLGCFELFERTAHESESARLVGEKRLRQAILNMVKFSWRFPIGWPQVFWGIGRYLELHEKRRVALAVLRAGLPISRRYRLRHDETQMQQTIDAMLSQPPNTAGSRTTRTTRP